MTTDKLSSRERSRRLVLSLSPGIGLLDIGTEQREDAE